MGAASGMGGSFGGGQSGGGYGGFGMGGYDGARFAPIPQPQPQRPQFTTSPDSVSPLRREYLYTPEGRAAGGEEQMNKHILASVRDYMGNYGAMVDLANRTGTSETDIGRAFNTVAGNAYTAMNRPDYKAYGPSGQFYQPIYQPSYAGYQQPSYFYSPGYSMPSPFSYPQGSYGSVASTSTPRSAPSNMIGGVGVRGRYAEGGEVDDNPGDDEGIRALLGRQ